MLLPLALAGSAGDLKNALFRHCLGCYVWPTVPDPRPGHRPGRGDQSRCGHLQATGTGRQSVLSAGTDWDATSGWRPSVCGAQPRPTPSRRSRGETNRRHATKFGVRSGGPSARLIDWGHCWSSGRVKRRLGSSGAPARRASLLAGSQPVPGAAGAAGVGRSTCAAPGPAPTRMGSRPAVPRIACAGLW